MADGTEREHVHAWRTVSFVLDDGRPLVFQACACAAERRIRAWERYWTPAMGEQRAGGRMASDRS